MKRLFFLCWVILGVVCSSVLNAATFDVTNSTELQDALSNASSNNEDNTINLAAGTYSSDSGFIYTGTNHALTLTGAGKDSTFISASNSIGISFTFSGTVTVSNLTVQDLTQSAHYTGLKFADGSGSEFNVVIHDCNFSHLGDSALKMNNNALAGSVFIHDNLFEYNHAVAAGGALYLNDTSSGTIPVQIINNIFNYNTSTHNVSDESGGGAVWIANLPSDSPVTLKGNVFDHNVSSLGSGGAIFVYTTSGSSGVIAGGSGEGEGNTFSFNQGLSGGAVAIDSGGPAVFVGNTVVHNTATDPVGQGGGAMIAFSFGEGEFSNNIVENNSAYDSAGFSIVTEVGTTVTFKMNANLISGNIGTVVGGASIFFPALNAPMVITNNIIVGNHGGDSGGMSVGESVSQDIYLINNTFAKNTVDNYFVGGLSIVPLAPGIVVNLYNNIFWQNTSGTPMKDVWVQQANPAWGGMNFFNNDVVNDPSVPDPTVATNICIDDPNDSYTDKCNLGSDFSTLPDTTVSGSSNPYALYDIDPGFLGIGDVVDQYSLTVNSQMIQAGDPSAPQLPEFDYTGTVPMDTPKPDLGALQYCVPSLSVTVTSASDTVVLGDPLSWTVTFNNAASCASTNNAATLTFTNSEFQSGDLSASLSEKIASRLHVSSGSVICSGSGTSATCTITKIPNAASVNLAVSASTVAVGDASLSVSVSNAVATASASGSGSVTVLPAPVPSPGDLSGGGCSLSNAATNSANLFWIYSLMIVLPVVRMKKPRVKS